MVILDVDFDARIKYFLFISSKNRDLETNFNLGEVSMNARNPQGMPGMAYSILQQKLCSTQNGYDRNTFVF